ncbi:MAG: hypothetical protein KME07_14135 [Pegethrix bostrychoides GSE-TBD4-15B]|jgi:hypothetical protein|uniref:Uncharacterized protein n=1 Tax=Pegethrix bostrychoides GSE-TBD4-15B TaxID=2839662 RepID=A0A951U569_9CYAN|nr:hypothetical protein [Pegethrix bostrychoides GSE-TBD4-15B]
MTSVQKTSRYSSSVLKRAERAVCCSPFKLALFDQMRQQSVDLRLMTGQTGIKTGYTKRPLAEMAAEKQLLWLMEVGLLRREVDGQGLTNSFRLTPLGHELVVRWREDCLPAPALADRFYNFLNRWLRWPSWLRP